MSLQATLTLMMTTVRNISENDVERATLLLLEANQKECGKNYRKTRLALMEVERLGGAREVFGLSFKQMCYRFFPDQNDLTLNRELTVGQIEAILELEIGTTTEYTMKKLKQFTKVGVRSNAVRGISADGAELIKECWALAQEISSRPIPTRLDIRIAAQETCRRHNLEHQNDSVKKVYQQDRQELLHSVRNLEEENRQLQAIIKQLRESADSNTPDTINIHLLRQTLEYSIQDRTRLHEMNKALKTKIVELEKKASLLESKYYDSLRNKLSLVEKAA